MTVVALLAALMLAPETLITGVVSDANGLRLARADVYVKGAGASTSTDKDGRFELLLPEPGPVTVVVFRHGFSAREVELVADGAPHRLDVVLTLAGIAESVTVFATPLSSSPSERTLRPMDVVQTPGAQADSFYALQSLPGVVTVDEGAGIYVRGGEVDEVRVTLDGIQVFHPYRYETNTGGQAGTVEPFLLEGLSFSSGGFPARFGNALSGVLDLRGLRRPRGLLITATAGLAAASARASVPLGQRGGVRFSGNRTFTRVLFAVNGSPRRFSRYPVGWDANLSLHYDAPRLGSFKLFGVRQHDDVGVEVERDNFQGNLESGSRNDFRSGHWEKLIAGRWRATAAVGQARYVQKQRVGVLSIDLADRQRSWRAALERSLGGWTVRAGSDGERTRAEIAGTVPNRGGDLLGGAGTRIFGVDLDTGREGAFVEAERTSGRLLPLVGLRVDRMPVDPGGSRTLSVDPRMGLAVDLGGGQYVRLAWGIFHQYHSPFFFGRAQGEQQLEPMSARHWIVGYERGSESGAFHLRAEAYTKAYRQLALQNAIGDGGYESTGYGSASGVDLYARQRWSAFEVRGNYSFLRARRRYTPWTQLDRFDLPEGSWEPDFSIPHTLDLTARYAFAGGLSLALRCRTASGKPNTPIVGSVPGRPSAQTGGLAIATPIFGPINSERLPRYERWDMSASYGRSWMKLGAVFFVGVTNLLARQNVFEYIYSPDYSQRRPVTNAAPRLVYVGVSLSRTRAGP
jgi:vitamin B12 transporter